MKGFFAQISLLLGLSAFLWNGAVSDRYTSTMENKLKDDIFVKRKINPLIRPAMYYNKTLTVKIGISMLHIIELDEKKQLLVSNNYVKLSWMDDTIKWDKEQYGGLDSIQIPSELIWKPDITLYNGAEAIFPNTMATIQSNGAVIWRPPTKLESDCNMEDIKDYPFDQHECILKFGSWTYDGYILDLRIDNSTKFDFTGDKPTEWDILSTRIVRTEKFYSCCQEPYPDVTYYVTLKRKSPYYSISLVLPVMFMMFVTLATFWLPPNAQERVTIGCFNLIFLLLILSHLHWVVPRSHVFVPRIVIFTGCTLFFTGLSLILAVWTITLSRRRQFSPTPTWFEKVKASKVSKILCLPTSQVVEEENLLNAQNVDTPQADTHDDAQSRDRNERENSASTPRITHHDWIIFTTAFNRFFFYAYCFCFIVVITYSFC